MQEVKECCRVKDERPSRPKLNRTKIQKKTGKFILSGGDQTIVILRQEVFHPVLMIIIKWPTIVHTHNKLYGDPIHDPFNYFKKTIGIGHVYNYFKQKQTKEKSTSSLAFPTLFHLSFLFSLKLSYKKEKTKNSNPMPTHITNQKKYQILNSNAITDQN